MAAERRDFRRAAVFAWMTLAQAALSSFETSVLNSFALSSAFFSAIAARTLRNCDRRFAFAERFRNRRTASCRIRFLALELNDRERAEKYLTQLAAIDFGYRDVSDRLDKLAALRDSV